MSDNYITETTPLFKLLRTAAFRFVIVCYNHYSFVQQLEKDLQERFPNRPLKKVNAQKATYQEITGEYFALEKGFFLIDNFNEVLKEEKDSQRQETPEMEANNERRRHITAGLNLRRDKLAKYPIALFVLLPAATDELYVKTIMEKMPDLWSFRSFMLDLKMELIQTTQADIPAAKQTDANIPLALSELEKKQTELQRLQIQLQHTPEKEIAYRRTLLPQIAAIQEELGNYESALHTLEDWEALEEDSQLADIWLKKGDIYTTIGDLQAAQTHFEKALAHYVEQEDKANIAITYKRLGDTYTYLGNLEQALRFFEDYHQLTKDLYKADPDNTDYKNQLAISYSKLGDTQSALGNLEQALRFFEDYNRLEKELYAAYPSNVAFKNSLAISYSKLGDTQSALGNLEQALRFFEEDAKLTKELYAAYPSNVAFKNGLAISYSRLGDTQRALGNLEQALRFFEDYNRLEKELYAAYPSNVEFKNSLAISYQSLGWFQETNLNDRVKANVYYQLSKELLAQLVQSFPAYVEFKKNLDRVEQKLAEE